MPHGHHHRHHQHHQHHQHRRHRSAEPSEDFESTKTLSAPPERVLAALRTPEDVTDWWGPATGSADVGGTFEVSFENHQASDRAARRARRGGPGRLERGSDAAHARVGRDEDRLRRRPPRTTDPSCTSAITVSRPQLECFDMCHAGWTHYLGSLVSIVDTGEGQPSRNETA